MTATSSNTVNITGLIRIGILALPLANALKLLGNLGTFNSLGYGVPEATEAAIASGSGFFVGEFVGSIVPVLLAPFSVFALFGYLAPRAPGRPLTAGLICAVLGAGITLPALGVINYAIPALAHAYQAGQGGAMAIADSFFTWPRGAMIYPAVLFPIGVILFAIAMWRSAAVPRTAAVLFAVSGVLIAIPVPLHSVRLAGGILGLVAGSWIAIIVRRELHAGGVEPANPWPPS